MEIRTAASEPESPCVQVCLLDAAGETCVGCGRSLGEIGEWSAATAVRKREILHRAAQRRMLLTESGEPT